jgi:hypothetical protein
MLFRTASLLAQTPTGSGGQSTDQQMWVFIGLGVMIMIYMTVIRPMMRRKDPLDRPTGMVGLSQQRSTERQMQNLLVELAEMSRQITAQLDTRSAKLEALIREADARIAELKSLSGSTETAAYQSLRSAFQPTSSARGAEADSRTTSSNPDDAQDSHHSEVYALADQGRDAYEIAAQLGRPRGEVELILALRSK